jgi:hypothetical protein
VLPWPRTATRRTAFNLAHYVATETSRTTSPVNPSAQKKQDQAAAANRTFEALAKLYVAVVGDEKSDRFKRSAAQDEANLVRHVLPKWEGRRYDQITRADVIELLDGIMAAGTPIAANRVHSLISGVFSFAIDADLLPFNPCVRLRKRGREQAGRRILSDAELRLFWSGVVRSPVSPRTGQGLRLALLMTEHIGRTALAQGQSAEGRPRALQPSRNPNCVAAAPPQARHPSARVESHSTRSLGPAIPAGLFLRLDDGGMRNAENARRSVTTELHRIEPKREHYPTAGVLLGRNTSMMRPHSLSHDCKTKPGAG